MSIAHALIAELFNTYIHNNIVWPDHLIINFYCVIICHTVYSKQMLMGEVNHTGPVPSTSTQFQLNNV